MGGAHFLQLRIGEKMEKPEPAGKDLFGPIWYKNLNLDECDYINVKK